MNLNGTHHAKEDRCQGSAHGDPVFLATGSTNIRRVYDGRIDINQALAAVVQNENRPTSLKQIDTRGASKLYQSRAKVFSTAEISFVLESRPLFDVCSPLGSVFLGTHRDLSAYLLRSCGFLNCGRFTHELSSEWARTRISRGLGTW
jgi:hypothetical protein